MTTQPATSAAGRHRPARRRSGAEEAVRSYLSVAISVTLVDVRPDPDGFGHQGADALLLRQAALWLDAHPGTELTGTHAGYDPAGRRQLVMTVDGWLDEGPTPAAAGHLNSVPEAQ